MIGYRLRLHDSFVAVGVAVLIYANSDWSVTTHRNLVPPQDLATRQHVDEIWVEAVPLALPSSLSGLNKTTGLADSQAILEKVMVNRVSLSSESTLPALEFFQTENGLEYATHREYGTSTPNCAGAKLDFSFVSAASFGLRGFEFGLGADCAVFETGDYDTAYWSVDVDPLSGITAFSVPGKGIIELFDRQNNKIGAVSGLAATALEFDAAGRLWATAFPMGGAWDQASLYRLDLTGGQHDIYLRGQLAEARGLAFAADGIFISDTFHHRLLQVDYQTMSVQREVKGFLYPNGLSITSSGDILVADEHHNLVRRFEPVTWREIWRSPPWQLLSPGSVEEIAEGRFKGDLLIADSDGNRIIVVEPKTWTIQHEVSGIASPMRATVAQYARHGAGKVASNQKSPEANGIAKHAAADRTHLAHASAAEWEAFQDLSRQSY